MKKVIIISSGCPDLTSRHILEDMAKDLGMPILEAFARHLSVTEDSPRHPLLERAPTLLRRPPLVWRRAYRTGYARQA